MVKKVLVVDDSKFIHEQIKHDLEGTEYEVVNYAKNGEVALEMYESQMPDVVTLDIILPGMEGLDIAKIMLKRWPDAKILVVSSLAYDETVEEAREAGVDHVLFKPFSKDELLKKLADVCADPAEES